MNGHENLFVNSAKDALAFLCRDYGFQLDSATADTNALGFWNYSASFRRTRADGRWQSATLQTTPDRGELYIDLAYGQSGLETAELTLTVWELLEIESSEPKPAYSVSDAFGDPEAMRRQYTELASILRDYGARFFECDQTLADAIDALRKMPQKERERQQKDRKIEAALAAGEWARAAAYLEGLGSKKTRGQRESLKLALANMRSGN